MKTWLRVAAPTAAAILLAACATLVGPRDVEIPLSRLQESVAARFPANNRYLQLVDVYVSNPKVGLLPETNRIVASMDATIAPSFLTRSWQGSMAVSGILKFDAARNALVLGDPRIERLDLDGLNSLFAGPMRKFGIFMAEQILTDTPVYAFKPDELRHGGVSYTLSKITTKADALVVTFEPLR